MINVNTKGKVGERRAGVALEAIFLGTFKRGLGQARKGGIEVADVVHTPVEGQPTMPVHFEVKTTAKFGGKAWLNQIMKDAGNKPACVVYNSAGGGTWLCIPIDMFPAFAKAVLAYLR